MIRPRVSPKQSERMGTELGSDVEHLRRELDREPWHGGRILESLTIPASSQLIVRHQLGHPPKGWWIVRISGSGGPVLEGAADKDTITLINEGASDTQVAIWIF